MIEWPVCFQASGDFLVLHNIARMLELAVPLMVHPNENFLAQLEEDMMKLILKHGMMVSSIYPLWQLCAEVLRQFKLCHM